MKNRFYLLLIVCGGLACACGTTAQEAETKSFGEISWEASATPLRPGVPGKSPFWNRYAERFIFPILL